jgi:hypothetical protein
VENRVATVDQGADLTAAGIELDRFQTECVRASDAAGTGDRDELVSTLPKEDRHAPAEEPGRARDEELHRVR